MAAYEDGFNRPNNTSLGTDWTDLIGDIQAINRVAKVLGVDGSGNAVSRKESVLDANDHGARITVIDIPAAGRIGTVVRLSASALTGYMGCYNRNGNAWEIFKWVAGTPTLIAILADTPGLPVALDILETKIFGSTISIEKNGVSKLSVVDTSILTGPRCGIYGTLNAQMDNFVFGDIYEMNVTRALRFEQWATCDRCGLEYPFSQMRVQPGDNGGQTVCLPLCYDEPSVYDLRPDELPTEQPLLFIDEGGPSA